MEPMLEWFKTSVDAVPMEHLRGVLGALIAHLDVTLEKKNWYDDGPEFRIVAEEVKPVGVRKSKGST